MMNYNFFAEFSFDSYVFINFGELFYYYVIRLRKKIWFGLVAEKACNFDSVYILVFQIKLTLLI